MEGIDFVNLFQGIATLLRSEPTILIGRICLIALGILLIYLGRKGVLEALLMIPMGLGMASINAGVLFFNVEANQQGTLFIDPLCPTCKALHQRLVADGLFEQLDTTLVLFPLDSDCNWMLDRPVHPRAHV